MVMNKSEKLKSKWLYYTFLIIILIGVYSYVETKIDNFIYKTNQLEKDVEELNQKLNNYEGTVSKYENTLQTVKDFKNSYKIEHEVPYEFIEYTEFEKYVTSKRQINLSNGGKITKAKVSIRGVKKIIDFLSYTDRQYEWYYAQSEINKTY